MVNEFLDVNVIAGPVPLAVYSVAGALAATLLVRRYRPRMAQIFVAAAGLGAGLGLLVTWLVSDVWDVFGVSFSPVTRGWVVAFGAGLGTVVVALAHAPRWRRACALIAIPAFLVAAATGINADFGQYATVRSVLRGPRRSGYPRVTEFGTHAGGGTGGL